MFSACSYQENKDVNKCKRKVCKIVGADSVNLIEDPQDVYEKKCMSMVKKIMRDRSHPLHDNFRFLRSGRRLNVPYCRTDRHQSTFVPSSVKLFNTVIASITM